MSTTSSFGGEPDRPAFAPPVAPEPRVGAAGPGHGPLEPAPPSQAGPPQAGAPERPWPWWSGFAALASGWLIGQVLAGIALTVGTSDGVSTASAPIGVLVVAQLLFSGCMLGAALFFARLGGPPTPERFGLRPVALRSAAAWVVVGLVASWIVASIWLTAVGADSERDELTRRLEETPSEITVAGLALLTVVVAPIVEEIVFRGFLFGALRSRLSVPLAAVVSGLVFGFIHAAGSPWQFLIPLAAFGAILALVYWKTGSLYPCIAMHAIWNCVSFGAARDWSWEIPLLMAGSGATIGALLLVGVRLGRRAAQPA